MKKVLLSLAVAAMMMSACTQDVAEPNGDITATLNGNVGVTAAMSESTRTSMTANENGALAVAWVAGDAIGLSANDATATLGTNVKYTANSSATSTTFNCADATPIKWGEGNHTFYAYYPYTEEGSDYTAVPASVPAVQEQSAAGNTDHLQPYAFLYAPLSAFSVLELNVCTESEELACESLIFRAKDENEIVSADGIKVNLADGSLDYTSATTSNQIQVNLGENIVLTKDAAQKIYMIITPGHAGKQFQAIAVVNGKEIVLDEMGVPETGIPAGRKAVLSLNIPVLEYETVNLNADGTTANTYIVPAVGTYSFKATVKGNGYTGAITSGRYGNAAEVHTFVNGAAGVNQTSVDLAPASAEVLWFQAWCPDIKVYEKTCPIIPESVVLTEEGNVEFTTTSKFIPGNAVIAVKDATGKIIWSWQIWLSEGYDPATTGINMGVNDIVMMDRNIGANISNENGVSDGWQAAQAVGMLYQHGRKDPFPGPLDIAKDCSDGNRGGIGYGAMTPDGVLMYGSNGQGGQNEDGGYTYIAATDYLHGLVQDAGLSGDWTYADAVAYANANPHRLIHNRDRAGNNYPYDWWGKRGDEANKQLFYYWGGPEVWPTCATVTKTIYDPCPAGWVVPGIDFGTTISKESTITAVNYGWNVTLPSGQTAYFPHTGTRWGDATNFQQCNKLGAYWVNAIGDNACGAMNFVDNGDGFVGVASINGSAQEYEGNNALSMGISTRAIRCVKAKASSTPVVPEPPVADDGYVNLSANGTANTYVANAAGTKFKFKATVKGNGYDPITGAPAEAINLEGANAYIFWGFKKTTSDGADNTGLNISVLRESVAIDGDYITFETPENMQDGNVGIAVADANGNIMWSWHIWCVQGYDYVASAVDVTTHGMSYKIMDRNLGAFCNPAALASPTEDDYAFAHGMYYQWGRKDPFLCGGTQRSPGTWFDFIKNGQLVKGPTFTTVGNAAYQYSELIAPHGLTDFNAILTASIQKPLNFFTGSNWATSAATSNGQEDDWGKLWGNQKDNSATSVKTMYDPCPVGYTVASPDHFKFVASTDTRFQPYTYPTWELNTPNDIVEGVNTLSESPWGMYFYTKGTRTANGHPEDKTTVFLPKQRWIQNTGTVRDNGSICLYTNAPSTESSWGGQPYKANIEFQGYAHLDRPSWTYAAEAACALAVRCVSENE